jgi:hypothetical protein
VSLTPVGAIAAPAIGRPIFDGTLPEGLHAIMVECRQERTLVVPDHFAMIFRRAARATEIRFVPGQEDGLGKTAAYWMLGDLLAALGRHLLHGASLVDAASGQSIAIFAPSGTGKTTTALALARAGFHLAGDDALVLQRDGDACHLWALPRKINVGRRTATLLPWLAPVLSDAWTDDEQQVEIAALSPVIKLAIPQPRPVKLVIVLTAPNGTAHAVSPVAKPDALVRIAADNLRIAPGGVDADNAAALAALTNLVASTRTIALSVGPDPASLSRALVEHA